MSKSCAVPADLVQGPFRGTEALRRGLLSRGQLRSSAWTRLFRGVYVHVSRAKDPRTRAEALRLCFPQARAVCGITAAWLWGVWTPPEGGDLPLVINRFPRQAGTPLVGLTRRQLKLYERDGDLSHVRGLTVTSPLRTCFDLMRERSLVEGVVVADAFAGRGLLRLEDLTAYCSEHPRWPRVRTARRATALATPRARSPGESRLRMVVILAGFREPLVNQPVRAPSGRILGIPDLWLRGPHPAGAEYDGAHHDSPAQYRADRTRSNRLLQHGVRLLHFDERHVTAGREQAVLQISQVTGDSYSAMPDPSFFARDGPRHPW
jgi:hypothetical protein